MATRLSIALRRESAIKRIDMAITTMAIQSGVVMPPAKAATKDPAEAEAVLLESLAEQLEALAGAAPPVPVIEPEPDTMPEPMPAKAKVRK